MSLPWLRTFSTISADSCNFLVSTLHTHEVLKIIRHIDKISDKLVFGSAAMVFMIWIGFNFSNFWIYMEKIGFSG